MVGSLAWGCFVVVCVGVWAVACYSLLLGLVVLLVVCMCCCLVVVMVVTYGLVCLCLLRLGLICLLTVACVMVGVCLVVCFSGLVWCFWWVGRGRDFWVGVALDFAVC